MSQQASAASKTASSSSEPAAPALLGVSGAVATITLNRPERFNAMNQDMVTHLRKFGEEVAARDEIRVVVINGAGPSFCAGGDIEVFAANIDKMRPMVTALLNAHHEFLTLLLEMPKLVLTSVHGAAAGAGLSLAFMGDMCIASEDAKFAPAYAKLGVSPDGGGTVGVVRAIGARRATQLFLAEDTLTAAEAERWGLVNKVVATGTLPEETDKLARRLARNEPAAIAATKTLMRQSATTPTRDQLDAEMKLLIGCMETGDAFPTAVRKFIGK